VEEEYSYDTWGRRRNAQDWTYTLDGRTPITDRGYCMHEHLDNFALINMNGRMYDPMLGRMLSPDNYVQAPFFTQSYNRYTYCFNNPLKYTDPSGEAGDPWWKKWIRAFCSLFNGHLYWPQGRVPHDGDNASTSNNADISAQLSTAEAMGSGDGGGGGTPSGGHGGGYGMMYHENPLESLQNDVKDNKDGLHIDVAKDGVIVKGNGEPIIKYKTDIYN